MKLNKLFYGFMLGCAMLIGITACDDDESSSGELTLGAPVITEIAAPTAEASALVNVSKSDLELGVIRVMAYGFCYGTTPSPTIYQNTVSSYLDEEGVSVTVLPDKDGKISAPLADLEDNTVYYVRAFATLYPNGVVYSPDTKVTVGTPAE